MHGQMLSSSPAMIFLTMWGSAKMSSRHADHIKSPARTVCRAVATSEIRAA